MADEPSEVVVRCTLSGEPFAGAFVEIRLPMWSKNQYALVFGPTDEQGLVRIAGRELTERTRAVLDFFPMDYVSFPREWSGGIAAEPVTDIERLRSAMRTWGDDDLYPPDRRGGLDEYERKLRGLDQSRLEVEVARTT